jgi:hypothetical protein
MTGQTNKPTLPEIYMEVDRQFFRDEQISHYLKSEIRAALESVDPARINATLELVQGALESNGASVVEAAEFRHIEQREKRARRRAS